MKLQFMPDFELSNRKRTNDSVVNNICRKVVLLEELIYQLAASHLTVELIGVYETGCFQLVAHVQDSSAQHNRSLGHIHILLEKEVEEFREKVIPYQYLEKEEFTYDPSFEEWYDRRDARLRVRSSSPEDLLFTPPSALEELLLSYLLSPQGIVLLSNQLKSEDGTAPFPCLQVTLSCCPPNSDVYQEEDFYIRMEELRGFVEGRVAKRELEEIPTQSLH